MKLFTYENILEQVTKKNRVNRGIVLCIGAFIIALIYNAFIVPNSVVYGGVGGVAIIVNKLTGIDTTLFINIATTVLLILSVILIGFKNTAYTIVGFLAYTVMVNITAPFADVFQLHFESKLFSIIIHGGIAGLGYGLIYRAGFNTGGVDSVVAILQYYTKIPNTKLSNAINGIIILTGAALFGVVNSIYAIVYLKVMNFVADRVLLGVSTSKVCFVKSRSMNKVENYLTEELDVGYTILDSTNGIGFLNKQMIMCVLPTDRFYDFKTELLKIDKKIEIISKDCYTVEGGKTNNLIKV